MLALERVHTQSGGLNPLHGVLNLYRDVIPSLVEGCRLKTGGLVPRGFKSHLPYFAIIMAFKNVYRHVPEWLRERT